MTKDTKWRAQGKIICLAAAKLGRVSEQLNQYCVMIDSIAGGNMREPQARGQGHATDRAEMQLKHLNYSVSSLKQECSRFFIMYL